MSVKKINLFVGIRIKNVLPINRCNTLFVSSLIFIFINTFKRVSLPSPQVRAPTPPSHSAARLVLCASSGERPNSLRLHPSPSVNKQK